MKLVQIGQRESAEVIAEMPQVPLPDLQDAVLSTEQLEALFSDLAEHATIGEIIFKGAATERVDARRKPTLVDAFAALRLDTVRGVQVRYLHEGKEWWDTLMSTPAGVRLVRIER